MSLAICSENVGEADWVYVYVTMNGVNISGDVDVNGDPASLEIDEVTGDIYLQITCEDIEPVEEDTLFFNADGIEQNNLKWDGRIIEPGDEIDVSFSASNLVSQSKFIDIEDIVPDFLVTVNNNDEHDQGATITRSGSGLNTQCRIQTTAQGSVEIYVQYNPVTFNDDYLSGNHGIYTNLTQVDFANLGNASVGSSFSHDSLWDSYDMQLDVDTHAIPLYTPRGFWSQVLQSEIVADPAQHQGFWLYIDPQSHSPMVCCVHGDETSVTSMNSFSSFGVLELQPGQSVDCINYFNNENFNGDINVARFFFEDLRGEISGAGNCYLFWDKSN